LVALPSIGDGIAAAIAEMCATGRWAQLERLTGALEPEKLFRTIPGVGPELAMRLHEALHVDTLEQLEIAAHDGRLEQIPGVGVRRAAAIRAYLSDRLGRRRIRASSGAVAPPIDVLLEVDASYRSKAAAGALKRIAPKRFNPSGEVWLPILHENRADWRFTALFSNTRRAHELGKTGDWVVVYFHRDSTPEGQCTIVTETHGPLKDRRVVRGREGECATHYGIDSYTPQ
jgi:putative hydrolase